MSAAPTWRVIRSANDPKFMVKGCELADTFLHRYRFRVVEVRAMIPNTPDTTDNNGYYMGVRYRVFDAHRVTDDEVRAGKSAPCVATFDTFDEAKKYCDNST